MLLFSKLSNENKRKSLSPLSLKLRFNKKRHGFYFINIKVIIVTVPITISGITRQNNYIVFHFKLISTIILTIKEVLL